MAGAVVLARDTHRTAPANDDETVTGGATG